MGTSPREKLRLLDEYLHAFAQKFYLRPSLDGPGAELSSSELYVLNIVGRRRRCAMTELAGECGLVLSSATGIVDRLVAAGCLKRVRDEAQDRRRVYVELDRKGQKIYQELLEAEMGMIITIMDSLEPKEQDALLEALGKAVGSLSK